MNAVLIDDDELNIELLKNLFRKYCPEVQVVGTADSVELAFEVIGNTQPDVLFVDIELHELTAKDLLDNLETDKYQVVIISAFERYALEMHKYQLADYILKPILITDLIRAVNNVKKQLDKTKQLKSNQPPQQFTQFIALPEKEHLNITHLEDIIRFEAKSNYTLIVLKENRQIITSKHLGAFEELLPRHVFIRAHNSHIVNVNYVAKYLRRKKYGVLELKDGTQVPISANRKKEVLERIIF